MAAAPKLNLKLIVDKKKNKVVFAESQRDFVDVLFSFLSLPVGTIVGMSNKKSQLGCMDMLYESVEKLDLRFMETKACKGMLLRPRSTAEIVCEGLKVDINGPGYHRIYRCPTWKCCTKTFQLYSLDEDAKCPCGLTMDKLFVWNKRGLKEDGVFVKGEGSFTISDDLRVTPTSTDATLSILRKCELMDCTALQEMTVEVGKDEIVNLLRRSLSSDTPLTDVCLRKLDVDKDANKMEKDHVPLTVEGGTAPTDAKTLKMKLLLSKSRDTLLYAEAGGDVVDFLFSFLTFPVGSIIEILAEYSCMGCLDNLYMSLEELTDIDGLVYFVHCDGLLLSPKLPPMYGCTTGHLLNVQEEVSRGHKVTGCEDCFKSQVTPCKHGMKNVTLDAVNPKLPRPGTVGGGGFTKGKGVFMITDDLNVSPLSSTASIHAVTRLEIPIGDLVVKEVNVGKLEALNLLKASLISRSALSNVFCQRKRARSPDKVLDSDTKLFFHRIQGQQQDLSLGKIYVRRKNNTSLFL